VKSLIVILLYIFYGITVFGQARLNISSGGSVYFYFNSLKKYSDGIKYENFTKLSIMYNDTNTTGTTYPQWKLVAKALQTEIQGEDPANTLNLDVIELEATSTSADANPKNILTATDVELLKNGTATGVNPASVFITYFCGETNKLIGKEPDYYVVDIQFTLMSQN